MSCFEDWDIFEREYISFVVGVIVDLEVNIFCFLLVGGIKVFGFIFL